MEPVKKYIAVDTLGRMLWIWRRAKHLSYTSAQKMLLLWIGHETRDLMTRDGVYPRMNFNEIRLRLKYKTVTDLLADVRKTGIFTMVGKDMLSLNSFFSENWHEYCEKDGSVFFAPSSRDLLPKCDGYNSTKLHSNTTVGNVIADAETFPAMEAEKQRRCEIVREYFSWVTRQTDLEHRTFMESIMDMICNPRDKTGHVISTKAMDNVRGQEVFDVLVATQLVPVFSRRDEFFRKAYLDHPEKRIWWMTHFMKKFGRELVTKARATWQFRHIDIETARAQDRLRHEQANHPLSPYEWTDTENVRWYSPPNGGRQQIPPSAPPRPSETSVFNYIKGEWKASPQPSPVGREAR